MAAINNSLLQEKIISEPLPFNVWAGPDFMGIDAYAFGIDTEILQGKIAHLHTPQALHRISTDLKGLRVGYVNSQGLAYIVVNKLVPHLDPVHLIPAMLGQRALMVWGTDGAGKTTIVQHFISASKDKFIIFDPKVITRDEGADKWLTRTGRVTVYGRGGDFETIQAQLHNCYRKMFDGGFGETTWIVIDEYIATKDNIGKDVPMWTKNIAAFGREPKVNIAFITHSERVKANGFDGEGDFFDMFSRVRLPVQGKALWKAKGYAEVPAVHPGPFRVAVEPKLDRWEKTLVHLAVKANGGQAGVNALYAIVQKQAPRNVWEPVGAPLSRHQIQKMTKNFTDRGLLIATGPNSQRVVSQALKVMAGCK